MQIYVLPGDGASSTQKGKLFEDFVKDIVLKHSFDTERVEFVPKDADIWSYEIISKTPLMVECKATETPVTKETVASFFGDFKLAQTRQGRIVGLLLSTSGFTSQGADSALAYYERIRALDEPFFVYDAPGMVNILADQGKLKHPDQLRELIFRATQNQPRDWYLIITQMARFWLVELDTQASSYILLNTDGQLVADEIIDQVPWGGLATIGHDLRMSVSNSKYAGSPLLEKPATGRRTSQSLSSSLTDRLSKNRRLSEDLELLCQRGRAAVFARLPIVDASLETLSVSFMDQLCSDQALDVAFNGGPAGLSDEERLARVVGSLRLAAIYLSAAFLNTNTRGTLGTPEEFANKTLKDTFNTSKPWTSDIPFMVSSIVSLNDSISADVVLTDLGKAKVDTAATICVLAIHFGAGLGPLCRIYKDVIHDGSRYDREQALATSPVHLRRLWVDATDQCLHAIIDAPTPGAVRSLRVNRPALQTVLERAEDTLDNSGLRLPFTRLKISIDTPGFEIIECRFDLDPEPILKIFMGEELYGKKDVWLRELIQNSIDATLLRQTLLDEAGYSPHITVSYDPAKQTVTVGDNGVGMSLHQVRKFFSKVGRSYYRSPELEEELRQRGKTFTPISRFGVGFLSVFLVAKSAEVATVSVHERSSANGLRIHIPALMEDFFVQSTAISEPGTTVTLHLKEPLKEPISDILDRYLLKNQVAISIKDPEGERVRSVEPNVELLPRVVNGSALGRDSELIQVTAVYDFGESTFAFPVIYQDQPRRDRRQIKERWDKLPPTRLALGQAGIFVKDDNEFLGTKKGYGSAYHPFFSRVYGFINMVPGKLKLGVSRNDFIIDDAIKDRLRDDMLDRLFVALRNHLETMAAAGRDSAAADLVRTVAFYAVADGQAYYYKPNNPASYSYSNSNKITEVIAELYAKFVPVEQIWAGTNHLVTLDRIFADGATPKHIYYSIRSREKEELFHRWIEEQSPDTRILLVSDVREAALVLVALKKRGYQAPFEEVTDALLQSSIHFTIVRSSLDNFLRAAAAVVTFAQYSPGTAVVVLGGRQVNSVSRARGLTSPRLSNEKPFVLIKDDFWLVELLHSVLSTQSGDPQVGECIREVCNLLVVQIACGRTKTIKREAVQAANEWLNKLYLRLARTGAVTDMPAVQDRRMLTLLELMGER